MDVTFSDDSVDSDNLQEQIQTATDETALKAFRIRIEGILNLTRSTTGLDLFFASHAWNPLGLAPSSIVVLLHHLRETPGNWLVIKQGQYSDEALRHHSWAFAAVSKKQTNLLCIREPSSKHAPFAIQHLCRVLEQTVSDHTLLEKQALSQRLSVELGRQAQNETLLNTQGPGKSARNLKHMGNVDLDVNIFSNAAEYTRNVLQAQACAIFDLIDFRMTNTTSNNTQSHGSSSTSTTPDSQLPNYNAMQTASSSSASSKPTTTAVSSTTSKASFRGSPGGQTHCSYLPSASPVRILGHSGLWPEHFENLSGEVSKPVIAEYLSMTRHSGLNSKTFIESKATPVFGLPALAPPAAKTLLCSSVAEADSQPAYLILALFEQEEVPFDQTEELFVEQIGANLIYSSIRSRVIAVDRAQMRFTLRIQHELRTPLHAIIGVNEIAKQSLALPFNLEEMGDLIDSIGTSADSLNVLVDDLVDFSLMERLSGERKMMEIERPLSDWDTLCGVITSTCLRGYQFRQRVVRMEQKLGKTIIPPPEMFVTIEDLYNFDMNLFKTQMDLEIIRRIVWKLVMNSLQATTQGLISIIISRKLPRECQELGSLTERLQIVVTDTGKGMEQKFLEERLFQPFGKEDEESSGVGLSLTICQHLAAQLAGRLTAKSIVGRGTRMTVSIPLKKSTKEVKRITPKPRNLPTIAFLGFETPSKRLFVDKFLDQFHLRETKDLQTSFIVVISFDDLHLQVAYDKEIEVISQRETRPEIIVMPALFLQELEEERSSRLDLLQLSLTQESRLIHRPMTVQEIREVAGLVEEVKVRQTLLQGSESMELAVSTLHYKTSSPLLRIAESPRRPSGSSDSSGRQTLDHPFMVLVVEDNPLNARIMTTMLQRANFQYKIAQNGQEGVELFEKYLPILVLLDINMPIMNGFEACQAMRKIPTPYTHRIIAITALSTEVEKRKGRESGMDQWLTKPTRMAPLLRDMKRWRREYEGVALSDPSTPSSTGGPVAL